MGGASIATGSDITDPSAKVMAGSRVTRIGRVVTVPDTPGPLRVFPGAAVIGRAANAPSPTLPRAGLHRISATSAAGTGTTPAKRTLLRKIGAVASVQPRPGQDTRKGDG